MIYFFASSIIDPNKGAIKWALYNWWNQLTSFFVRTQAVERFFVCAIRFVAKIWSKLAQKFFASKSGLDPAVPLIWFEIHRKRLKIFQFCKQDFVQNCSNLYFHRYASLRNLPNVNQIPSVVKNWKNRMNLSRIKAGWSTAPMSNCIVHAIFTLVYLKKYNLFSPIYLEQSSWNFQDLFLGKFREDLSNKIFI